GNYVVGSPSWNSRGAATWGDGRAGERGTVSAANSLVGSNPEENAGFGVVPLSNGNYGVGSLFWNSGRGAATWGDGRAGVTGPVSEANSLVGSKPVDQVGRFITPLSNGNYVVRSPSWNSARGAATWGDGTTGQTLDGRGVITPQNSLVGRAPNA